MILAIFGLDFLLPLFIYWPIHIIIIVVVIIRVFVVRLL